MTDEQWQGLLAVLRGATRAPLPTGFIIDSPWLPNWAGHKILDYYASERVWIETNFKAIDRFPGTWFLPGFWSEYGMCTEPSAFGAVSVWAEDEFPFAKPILRDLQEIERLEKPDARKDGLLPFVVQRLRQMQPEIEARGHKIRFAIARGPLNIASFLMGTTELLMALKTDPELMHKLLGLITDFMVDWIAWQRECFPTIDGVLVLDDLVGFVGPEDFEEFALPYLKRVFDTNVAVKFFHNDAPCKVAAPYLSQAGINLLNFGIQHTLGEMKEWTGGSITLLGIVPPRDVMAGGTAADVRKAVIDMLAPIDDRSRLIVSCAGGMPPGVPSENVDALIQTVNDVTA